MKNNLIREEALKWLCPAAIFVAGLFIYMSRITYSGLWLDEAVEYFYSKVMSGPIGGISGAKNMYERICSTYQPPLYNVMMYLWLRLFDSEESFRLAGILTTLVGMLGIYNALLKSNGYKWASAGALIYIFIPSTAFYALECAEYNLMLCCEAWTLNFFVSYLNENSTKNLAGFFIFSCLSVYSQYGAVFFVAGLYIVLLANSFRDKTALKKIMAATVLATVIAVMPLVYFFVIPQMIHQGSAQVSHLPVFEGDNILYDFLRGMILQAKWSLYIKTRWHWDILTLIFQFMLFIPFAAAFIPVFGTMFSKKKMCAVFASACVVSILLYYGCVVTSFYSHISYATRFGNRYGLFFIPLWLFTAIHAASVFCQNRKKKTICAILMLCFILGGGYYIHFGWVKSDAREAVEVWHHEKAFQGKTFVYARSSAECQFYIKHKSDYSEAWQKNITVGGGWMRKADYDSMRENLKKTDIFSWDDFFYIGQANDFMSESGDSISVFKRVMSDEGYTFESLYENGYSEMPGDRHILLRLHREK